jgi:hypothetical protein
MNGEIIMEKLITIPYEEYLDLEKRANEKDENKTISIGLDDEPMDIDKMLQGLDDIHTYYIVMADYDTFIVNIKQDVNRPNNPSDDEIIAEYMTNNYYGHSYEVIDNYCRYETIEL